MSVFIQISSVVVFQLPFYFHDKIMLSMTDDGKAANLLYRAVNKPENILMQWLKTFTYIYKQVCRLFLLYNTFKFYGFLNLLTLKVPDKDYSRNVSCAQN